MLWKILILKPAIFYICQEEDERIRSKDKDIARRRAEISRLDDRPPGLDDPLEKLSAEDAAAIAAARLAEEAEMEAESLQLTAKIPPGPPPGLPPHLASGAGVPPGKNDHICFLWD